MNGDETYGRVITGDAMDLIPTLEDDSVALVVTSPPYPGQYGNAMSSPEWLAWTKRWLALLEPKLTSRGVLALNLQFKRSKHGWYDHLAMRPGDVSWSGYNLLDVYIYGKTNPPPNGVLTYCDPPGWEFIFILTNASRPEDVTFHPYRAPYKPKSFRRDGSHRLYSNMSGRNVEPHPDGARQTTLMMMSKSADQNRPSAHGISFPRALPDRFIRQYTNPGELVLDPFCGVGTTVRVAVELGRRAIGFEIDPEEAKRARAWLTEPFQDRLHSDW